MSSLEANFKWQSEIKKISEGVCYIWKHGEFYDCEFIVDGEHIKAHRLVLSARSPVFAALLMEPNSAYENVVEAESVTKTGFRNLLGFIYTNEIGTDDKSSIVQAYLAANHYQQPSLKARCEEIMNGWYISEDEVCRLLNVSFNVPVLKEKCLAFIKGNANNVVSTEGFLDLTINCISILLENDILKDVPLVSRIERIMEWAEKRHTKPVDYEMIREDFLSSRPPILPLLGLESLTVEEFTDLFYVKYEGLLNDDETKKFMKYIRTNGRTSLPNWNQE